MQKKFAFIGKDGYIICYETISNQWSESSSARSTEDRSVRHPHIGGDRIASSRGGGGTAGGGGILSEQQRRGAGRPDRGDALQRDRWNRHQSGGLHPHQRGPAGRREGRGHPHGMAPAPAVDHRPRQAVQGPPHGAASTTWKPAAFFSRLATARPSPRSPGHWA